MTGSRVEQRFLTRMVILCGVGVLMASGFIAVVAWESFV
jgi:hypothetical protein